MTVDISGVNEIHIQIAAHCPSCDRAMYYIGFASDPGSDIKRVWLPQGELKILDILVSQGSAVERSTLDDATGFKRSSRDAYLSRMMAKRLIEVPQSGMVKASDALFD